MLAMEYGFDLGDGYDMGAIRARVAEKGPAFDACPGLLRKAFLADQSDGAGLGGGAGNIYATFYLWESARAAEAFLTGAAFHALCAAFGRPRVRLMPVLAVAGDEPGRPVLAWRQALPLPATADLGALAAAERVRAATAADRPNAISRWTALDPAAWELVRITLYAEAGVPAPTDGAAVGGATNGSDRRFEVLRLSAPVPARRVTIP